MTKKGKTNFQQIKLDISAEMRQNIKKLDEIKLEELLISTTQVRTLLSEIMTDNSVNTGSCNKI